MSLRASTLVSSASAQGSALEGAVWWITSTLLGTVATTLCIIAVALIGFAMFAGRLPVRRGLQVILGCFLLLGAPVIATALGGLWRGQTPAQPPLQVIVETEDPRGDLPPAEYDPYAEAPRGRDRRE